jgi:hypothetical protein
MRTFLKMCTSIIAKHTHTHTHILPKYLVADKNYTTFTIHLNLENYIYVNIYLTEMQFNVQLHPLLHYYLSFVPSETIKNAKQMLLNA